MTETRVYTCAHPKCGRKLKRERWLYSRFTGLRYCWPGECKTDRKGKK